MPYCFGCNLTLYVGFWPACVAQEQLDGAQFASFLLDLRFLGPMHLITAGVATFALWPNSMVRGVNAAILSKSRAKKVA